MQKKRILVAVLNWGLGHATRCIPIINELQKNEFEVFIASDGAALELLKKEFPSIKTFELPSYDITYTKSSGWLKWKIFAESPRLFKIIQREKKVTRDLVKKYELNGIISDNRPGCRYKHIKCVFITHQFSVLSGNTTYLSSKLHQKYISKFDECWIPDAPGNQNLSGIMGHLKEMPENVKYIGPLSRFNKLAHQKNYDYTVILSGPEPQRTMLEEKLLDAFQNSDKKIVFIRGVIDKESISSANKNLVIKNYLTSKDLQENILSSEIIICRSGYSSIMDLAKLEKKAFFIPTPGQFEQEYLAERFTKLGIAPFCKQENFKLSKLEQLESFSGFSSIDFKVDFRDIFTLFQGE
ncbi:glycosyltransferase [Salegentibacter sp. JZCK2]|uniref:glycosyltransferase n=1 Tax=Salegentibacter tibetensis TaxID=2873600 RepID=UPI001CCABC72|nr:glycosyltransferase [Salegentibacter tibetensis]MBZ9728124.1 glycosyltransferase [Salegentibacter tibetensis]